MARPQKDNADYFSHDCDMRNDIKIKALRTKYGIKGYAFWCMILEVLTNEENFEYSYSELDLELLAGDFGMEYEEIDDIINYCLRLQILQLSDDESVIYSSKHKERFEPLLQKRERQREYIQSRRSASSKKTEPKKTEEKPKAPTKESKAVDECKKAFSEVYKERTGVVYSWTKTEDKEFKDIVSKLVEIRKSSGLDEYMVDELIGSLKNLLKEASEDEFINDIFTASIINKNFNQLCTKMANKTMKGKKATKAQKMKDLQYEEELESKRIERSKDLFDNLWRIHKEAYIKSNGPITDGKQWALEHGDKVVKDYEVKCNELSLPIMK